MGEGWLGCWTVKVCGQTPFSYGVLRSTGHTLGRGLFFLRGDNSHCLMAAIAEARDQTLLPVENQVWAGGMCIGVVGTEMR